MPRSSTYARRRPRARTSISRTSSRARARSCRSASPRSARASATRSARATRSSGRASSSRWRCSTSSGPRLPRPRRSRTGCRAAWRGTNASASRPSDLRLREHAPDELAHYAKKAVDVEYRFPFGWKELEGVHNRGDFDLVAPFRGVGREARVLRPGDRRARHPLDRRDRRGRRPGRLHVPHRCLPRGGGPR